MIAKGKRYPKPGGMFALSFFCHLAIFSLVIWFQSAAVFHPADEPLTYVDLVTLPVASPQSGTPSPAAQQAQQAPAAPAPAPAPAAMALPAAKPKAKPLPAAKGKAAKPAPVNDDREFSERMAKIERQSEEKRVAEALDRLRKGGGRVGMPGAKGTEAGSDYASYIRSRLVDAFKEVMASQTRTPEVWIKITIGPDGRITEYRVEKKSGDPLFDDAVSRAVTLAGRSFRRPPGGAPFTHGFRFKTEGVTSP